MSGKARKGWVCPKCDGGVAPGVKRCPCVEAKAEPIGVDLEKLARETAEEIRKHTPPPFPPYIDPNIYRREIPWWEVVTCKTTDAPGITWRPGGSETMVATNSDVMLGDRAGAWVGATYKDEGDAALRTVRFVP